MPIAEIDSRGLRDARHQRGRRPELLYYSSLGEGEIDFSIVVPAHNRPLLLGQCLQAIARLAYPVKRFEVIVVDDGSEESLEPEVVPFLGHLNLSLLRQSNTGPAGARNGGVAAAKGRYVVFTDDDCRPDPGWLGALARRLAENPECAAGGNTTNGLAENLFSRASQVLVEFLYRHWNRDADDAIFLASNNLAFPRARFVEVRGFDTNFPLAAAEDRELCARWRWQGGRIVFAPDAIVHHFHTLHLKTFIIQHFNYGRGEVTFRSIRRQRGEPRAPVEREPFYRPLLGYVFTRDRDLRGFAVAMLIVLSQFVMPMGYLRQLLVSRAKTFAVAESDRLRE